MTTPATPLEVVRTLTGLTAGEVTDAQITTLLALHEAYVGSFRLTAADALEIYAGQLITAVQSDDISLDGSKRAAVLMARATRLREQAATAAAEADDGFAFDVVPSGTCRPELTERGYW